MDWFQFIATVIGHIAWPAVMIVLLIVLRHHVGALADRLEEFSFGGAKFVWKKTLREAAEIIKDIDPREETKVPEKPVEHRTRAIPGRYRTVDAASPTNALWRVTTIGAIISNYAEVEAVLFDIGDMIGIDAAAAWSVMGELRRRKLVSPLFSDLFEKVRMARNIVAHGQAFVSPDDEQEYARLTTYVKDALIQLRQRLPQELKQG